MLHPENDFPCCAQTQPQTPSGETAPETERGGEAPTVPVERTGSRPAVHHPECNAMCGDGDHFLLGPEEHDARVVSSRSTDWGVRDDATGNVGTVGAYNRAAAERWLAELSEPSTLMRRERTTYKDDVTEWVEVKPNTPPGEPS